MAPTLNSKLTFVKELIEILDNSYKNFKRRKLHKWIFCKASTTLIAKQNKDFK